MEVTWSQYIEEVLPNPDDRESLRAFVAAVLNGDRPDKSMFLYGPGLCGKSCIKHMINLAASDIERKENVITVLSEKFGRDLPGLMGALAGTRLFGLTVGVALGDMVGFLKALVTGDEMFARSRYAPEATNTARFAGGVILEGNLIPPEFEVGTALGARFTVLEPRFVERFRDQTLPMFEMSEQIKAWAA